MNNVTAIASQAAPTAMSLSTVTMLFALALALALLIERLLEVLKAGYDLIDSRYNFYKFWTRRANKIRDYAEKKLRVFDHVAPEKAAPVLDRFSEMLLNGQRGHSGAVPVLAGDLVRALWVRIFSKVIGMILGIAAAAAIKIDLVALWQLKDPGPAEPFSHYLLTGIAIGLGSGPVHKLITTIEKRRKKRGLEGGVQ
jgi:hypothetical protein